jgi:hypothetical protein
LRELNKGGKKRKGGRRGKEYRNKDATNCKLHLSLPLPPLGCMQQASTFTSLTTLVATSAYRPNRIPLSLSAGTEFPPLYEPYSVGDTDSMFKIWFPSQHFSRSRGSSVGIAADYCLEDREVGVPVPAGSRNRPDRLWGPHTLTPNESGWGG